MLELIGMLDSPFVRRVAISLQLLGLRFEHQSLSVFRTFEQFSRINPVVKAPTMVCEDGTVLMDSTLMLQYAQALAPQRLLLPADLPGLRRELRLVGLALAACEKAVQIYYEQGLRPAEKLHQPWLERVTGQLASAFSALEEETKRRPLEATSDSMSLAGVSTAVAWEFASQVVPQSFEAALYPTLAAFSAKAEALPEFQAARHGSGTVKTR